VEIDPAKWNGLLDLLEDQFERADAHLRSRGITPPQHDLMTDLRAGLAALRVPNPAIPFTLPKAAS
jgi:hypothetical protein